MADYNQPNEIAFKRRKLDGGQKEDIFSNEESHQKSFVDRIGSFMSNAFGNPIRSLWRIMRPFEDENLPITASENSVVTKMRSDSLVKNEETIERIRKEDEVVVLSHKHPTSSGYSLNRSLHIAAPLNHLSGSSFFSPTEDEEIKILEEKIANEDLQSKNDSLRPTLSDSDDDVQVVSVVKHRSFNVDLNKDDIQKFKDSIFQSCKGNTVDSESYGLGTSNTLDSRECSANAHRPHDSFVVYENMKWANNGEYQKANGSRNSRNQFIGESSCRTLNLPINISKTHQSFEPLSTLSTNTKNHPASVLFPYLGLKSTADKAGRWKDDDSARLGRVKRQCFWKDVSKRRNSMNKMSSQLQKVIDMDARERYRRFLNSIAPNCNVVNFPALPARKKNVSPSEILLRGRNILDQIFSENVTPASSSPSTKSDSLPDVPKKESQKLHGRSGSRISTENGNVGKCDDHLESYQSSSLLRPSVSLEIDTFEARLETEKSNSVITRDRLLRHMCKSELRQKQAEVLTLEKKLRETARRDEEISLEEEIRKKLTISGYVFRDRKPKPEKIEFPELDDSALKIIKTVWHSGGSVDEKFGERITRKDLLTLRGLDWLNDEVIDAYLALVCERAKKNSTLPKVYAFSTFFYTNLEQFGYPKVKRWTRKVDIFTYDIILVPIHLGAHWCLAVIDLEMKCIEYYDSMGGVNNRCLDALKSYLKEESLDKKKQVFSLDSWKFYCCQDIPHQKNGSDCGMFACKFADFRSRRARIIFSQENMPYYRQRMVYEICKKSLM